MAKKASSYQKIFSLKYFSSSKRKLLAYISESIQLKQRLWIVTPNPEFVIASKTDPDFLRLLQKADLAIPDGIGLIWASQVLKETGLINKLVAGLKTGIKIIRGQLSSQVITGTDLMAKLCQLATKKGWSIFLLGGSRGVAKKTLKALKKRFPGLSGWQDSGPVFGGLMTDEINQALVKKINRLKPTFLFVALGMKKQEQFISQNWPQLKVQLAIGVGGAFDYLSGRIKRPTRKWRQRGLEWFLRLLKQPWRIRRQLALSKFVWLVLKSTKD